MDTSSAQKKIYSRVAFTEEIHSIVWLTSDVVKITFGRPENFDFASGQHIIVSYNDGVIYDREYSIYSAESEEYLSILVRVVPNGYFTSKLSSIKIGHQLKFTGPHGKFSLNYDADKRHVFIATGTGVSPFVSMIKSYDDLEFHLIHGIRHLNEDYSSREFNNSLENKVLCISGNENHNHYEGRVSNYLNSSEFKMLGNEIFYLCGNFDMIYDVQNILKSKGVDLSSIRTEVYF